MSKKIKILIVEDSVLISKLLLQLFSEVDDFEVVGCASDGVQAVEMTKNLSPDIITMDIEMPKMNGFEATKHIMSECPTPIVIVSSHVSNKEMRVSFHALNAGALTVIEKPHDVLSAGFDVQKRTFINTLRALSEVRVVRRSRSVSPQIFEKIDHNDPVELLVLGASTGGPEALYFILSQLPVSFAVPIVIVQHICDGFLSGLVSWLQSKTSLAIEIIDYSECQLLPGHIYFPKDNYHLLLTSGKQPIAVLDDGPPVGHFKPSIDCLFESVAKAYPKRAMGGLLTGMGKDGAEGLLAMRNAGCITFAQNESSCVVYGMPAAAHSLNACDNMIDLMDIPSFLMSAFQRENKND